MKAHTRLAPWRVPGALVVACSLAHPVLAQTPSALTLAEARALPVGAPAAEPAETRPSAELLPPPLEEPVIKVRRRLFTRWPAWWSWRPLHKVETTVVSMPQPTSAELARLESGQASLVESAATKIKLDEAASPARRAAIAYLATVRCHYYPEAEEALIAALRADRSEAVRYEAAQALAQGCCCTPRTVEALKLVVTASERDGNPAETSDRVKTAALYALQRMTRLSAPAGTPPDMLPPAARQPSAPAASVLQLTSFTTEAPHPAATDEVTEADLHFAQTAGVARSAAPAADAEVGPRPSALPVLRVAPIARTP